MSKHEFKTKKETEEYFEIGCNECGRTLRIYKNIGTNQWLINPGNQYVSHGAWSNDAAIDLRLKSQIQIKQPTVH